MKPIVTIAVVNKDLIIVNNNRSIIVFDFVSVCQFRILSYNIPNSTLYEQKFFIVYVGWKCVTTLLTVGQYPWLITTSSGFTELNSFFLELFSSSLESLPVAQISLPGLQSLLRGLQNTHTGTQSLSLDDKAYFWPLFLFTDTDRLFRFSITNLTYLGIDSMYSH